MAKIYAPNREYNGISAGVAFCKGMAQTEDARLLEWFKDHGYVVEEINNPSKKVTKKAGE